MALLKTCEVIRVLAASKDRITVAEIAQKVETISKADIMSLMPNLINQGRVLKEKLPGEKRYRYWYNPYRNYKSGRGYHKRQRMPLWQRVDRGQEKIALLNRVRSMDGLSADAIQLIDSMMKDYGVKNDTRQRKNAVRNMDPRYGVSPADEHVQHRQTR